MQQATAILVVMLSAAAAWADCNPKTATWGPATGSPDGYEVEVSRDGGAFAKLADVAGTTIAVSGADNQVVKVRVRAFATDATPRRVGSWSPESVAVTFCPPLGVPGAPSWSAGPTAAILSEPDLDVTGAPLGDGNPLWACVAWTPGKSPAWLDPRRAVDGRHEVPWPATTSELPAEYRARCIYPAGWGPEALAVAHVSLDAKALEVDQNGTVASFGWAASTGQVAGTGGM